MLIQQFISISKWQNRAYSCISKNKITLCWNCKRWSCKVGRGIEVVEWLQTFDLLCWEFTITKHENMHDMEGNTLMDVIVVGAGIYSLCVVWNHMLSLSRSRSAWIYIVIRCVAIFIVLIVYICLFSGFFFQHATLLNTSMQSFVLIVRNFFGVEGWNITQPSITRPNSY